MFLHGYGSRVLASDVETSGDSFRFGTLQDLMPVDVLTGDGVPFAVHPDGNRIVHTRPDPAQAQDDASPIHFVTDWQRALLR